MIADNPRFQKTIKCKAKLYKVSSMQRCPYIHEMKERLLGEQIPMEPLPKIIPQPPPLIMDQQPVGTVVKLNSDGYGSHTSPTHTRNDRAPLMPRDPEDEFHCIERTFYPKNANKMVGGGELKVATVEVESIDNMATLPVSRTHGVGNDAIAEKNNASNKEMELKKVQPKPDKRTSLFIIMSFVYAKLLIVICIAYVISHVVTHSIPLYYYEGFFTYLYGMSILFLLYVFCFLLQESTCCSGDKKEKAIQPQPSRQKLKEKEKERKKEEKQKKKEEKEKKKKELEEKKKEKEKEKEKDKDKKKDKKTEKQEQQLPQQPLQPPPPPPIMTDAEAGLTVAKVTCRKRKTTQNDQCHGSFFLRIGAIAFGLGTMIYNGLEFGTFFEIPFHSRCYMILRGVNPVLQMVFTFMQMYFIFMNSRLNIHRFKVIARFGLMHVVATNICVWIRTVVIEYLKEITMHHTKTNETYGHALFAESIRLQTLRNANAVMGTHDGVPDVVPLPTSTPSSAINSTIASVVNATALNINSTLLNVTTTVPSLTTTLKLPDVAANEINGTSLLGSFSESLIGLYYNMTSSANNSDDLSCGRVKIMGNIVRDAAPYLFPFIIEYSLIGAAVIYVMWKHIGRNPRYVTEEDLEHRLEVMLSRRAVAISHAQHGRVDCVGASKGLFFGLLMLVAALICLILFFVLIRHPDLHMLAIYLADVSHCVLMVLSIFAIIIGFARVQQLKFKIEELSDLNDILLRVSAFGLFIYAVFSVIAGSLNAFTLEPNLLVMVTGLLSVIQVVLQLLFIADVSRRRVHLPEHDRSKPGRQVVTFLLICNVTMWIIYTFEAQKVDADPVQLEFYGFLTWAIIQRLTLPLCIFHRFHSAVTLAEIWKTSYKARLE